MINRLNVRNHNKGFTVLELMISTAIFSVVLLLCTFAMVQIGRIYFKGVNSARTQEVTRSISDSITQAVQFSGSEPVSTPAKTAAGDLTSAPTGAVCIGKQRFSYVRDVIITDSPSAPNQGRYGLVQDRAPDNGTCPSVIAAPPAGSQELIAAGMRLSRFSVVETTSGYEITVGITQGPFDISDGAPAGAPPAGECENGTSSQFCAFSQLISVAKRRL